MFHRTLLLSTHAPNHQSQMLTSTCPDPNGAPPMKEQGSLCPTEQAVAGMHHDYTETDAIR